MLQHTSANLLHLALRVLDERAKLAPDPCAFPRGDARHTQVEDAGNACFVRCVIKITVRAEADGTDERSIRGESYRTNDEVGRYSHLVGGIREVLKGYTKREVLNTCLLLSSKYGMGGVGTAHLHTQVQAHETFVHELTDAIQRLVDVVVERGV